VFLIWSAASGFLPTAVTALAATHDCPIAVAASANAIIPTAIGTKNW